MPKIPDNLIEIKIGQDVQGGERRRLIIYVKEEDKYSFDQIHRYAVEVESKELAKKLTREYVSNAIFKILNI